ncbi:peptide methionine sulfoxide reductase [Stemphylium lycopersici]|uniref:peptide-methionine (S)-S-oxide reductase n=1 Tax=Stemphylium lycopersici TaxID=183478 RepID=A0A364N707_STELY|nr:peptide methionine sulfoxide reductase [Stemphylium lycopersici]RAR13128.1 peptide methionine sulfoxide reductase msrB/msrA [Stemphylium lycopersici]
MALHPSICQSKSWHHRRGPRPFSPPAAAKHAVNGIAKRPQQSPSGINPTPKLKSPTFNLVIFLLLALFSMSFLTKLLRPFSTMSNAPAQPMTVPSGAQTATVAAGCFWGVEHMYRKEYKGKGLYDARVGYIGGDTENPGYRAVCSGRTGHAEALQVVYDPNQVTYRSLLEFFYKMHDPTTANRQGPDVGSQYRSAIFYHDAEQEKIARDVTDKVNKQWWKGAVATEILPAGKWWDAEEYHQLYLDHNPGGYECPSHFLRSFPPLAD